MSIDCKQAASMVMTSLTGSLRMVTGRLLSKPSVLFEFLQGVMAHRYVLVCMSVGRLCVVVSEAGH